MSMQNLEICYWISFKGRNPIVYCGSDSILQVVLMWLHSRISGVFFFSFLFSLSRALADTWLYQSPVVDSLWKVWSDFFCLMQYSSSNGHSSKGLTFLPSEVVWQWLGSFAALLLWLDCHQYLNWLVENRVGWVITVPVEKTGEACSYWMLLLCLMPWRVRS